jgi:hypothetical protein
VSLGFAEQDKIGDLIEYVMEYERLVLKKEEFIKQKRTKNAISNVNRCMAIISSGSMHPNEKELRTVRDARKGNPLGLVNQILYRKPRCTL